MRKDWFEFDTPYGPAYVVYSVPEQYDMRERPEFTQALVRCPGYIVWDSNGKWYPEPQVVDYALPRMRAVCDLIGVPAYEWLSELRRGDIWAIEREFQLNSPVSMMMDYAYEDDYNGPYVRYTKP